MFTAPWLLLRRPVANPRFDNIDSLDEGFLLIDDYRKQSHVITSEGELCVAAIGRSS